jgi:hypothetical protein
VRRGEVVVLDVRPPGPQHEGVTTGEAHSSPPSAWRG